VPSPQKRTPRSSATDRARRKPAPTPYEDYARQVTLYTQAGGQETLQRVVTALSRLGRRLDVAYRQQFDELNITHGEWSVLVSLAVEGRDGDSTPTKLADVCGVSPSTMTHRLDRMAERNLVVRVPDPENRTRIRVHLAEPGWQLFTHAILDAEVVESRLLSPLSPEEREQLADLLEKVVVGLRSH
jgi:DNA-binding MarR family transcriptional regulator